MIASYQWVLADLGAGDGAAVLRAARRDSNLLAIGVDSNAEALREVSRKAAQQYKLPNALFLVGDATEALRLLRDRVDDLRITLPWGSLLKRVLEGERAFALAVAGAV